MLSGNSDKKSKHLILFFDINDTMYIGDSAKGVNKEAAILKLLAEHYSAVWDEKIATTPMTFKDFVEQHLCPGNKRASDIQKQQIDHYTHFIAFLTSRCHPLTEEIKQKQAEISHHLQTGNIPQSFINLITYLEAKHYQYTLIFRTFGHDIGEVEKELFAKTFLKKLAHAHFNDSKLITSDGAVFSSPAEILHCIKPGEHGAWNDNFADWHNVGETHAGGKPYPIDLANDKVVSIFWDDNAESKEILCIKPTDGRHIDQKSMQKELIRQGKIVPVSTLLICTDNNYYIERVEKALHCTGKLIQQLGVFALQAPPGGVEESTLSSPAGLL